MNSPLSTPAPLDTAPGRDAGRGRNLLIALGCFVLAGGALAVRVIDTWVPVQLGALVVTALGGSMALIRAGTPRGRSAGARAGRWLTGLGAFVLFGALLVSALVSKLGIGFTNPRAHPATPSDAHGIYVVEATCAPPDTSTECGQFSTAVYRRVGPTPFLRHLRTYDCLFSRYEFEGTALRLVVDVCRDGRTAPHQLEL